MEINFKEWLELDEGWKDWAKKAALTGAMLAGGSSAAMGATHPDAASFLQGGNNPAASYMQNADSNYHWNSQIGRYTVKQLGSQIIYQTKNGNYVRVPSKLDPTGYKFVKTQ